MNTSTTDQIVLAARRTTPRWWALTALSAATLIFLYVALPVAGVQYAPASTSFEALYGPSTTVLNIIDVTTVLVVIAALAVVSVVRKLPYGIGSVLTLSLGATLSSAAARTWLTGQIASSALPDGRVVAAAALIASAALVVPRAVRPAVLGLGVAFVAGVALAAVVTAAATAVGVVGAVAVAGLWWGVAGALMTQSPVAAARERKNPMDTAALMLRRR